MSRAPHSMASALSASARTAIHTMALATLMLAGLAGCALGPTASDPVGYDFKPAPAKAGEAKMRQAVLVPDVVGPIWMDTPAIFYRLAYRDAARPQAYSGSRWVMPPAILFTNRLRQKVAAASSGGVVAPSDGIRAPYTLRLEIEDFSQVFESESKSHAALRLRASVLNSRSLVAQKSFSVDVSAARPDADSGVRALTAASEQAMDQVIDWAAGHIR